MDTDKDRKEEIEDESAQRREHEARTPRARAAAEEETIRREAPNEALERDRLQNYLNAGSLNS